MPRWKKRPSFFRLSRWKKPVEIIGSETDMKECTKCFKIKSSAEFGISNTNAFGQKYLKGVCKKCHNMAGTQKYNPYKKQSFKYPKNDYCELCKKSNCKIVFDHDHKTKEHRGWLCDKCNTSIGVLSLRFENEEIGLEKALNYLRRDKTSSGT